MSTTARLKVTCTLISLSCLTVWLLTAIPSGTNQSVRDAGVFSFISSKTHSLHKLVSWISDVKAVQFLHAAEHPGSFNFNKKNNFSRRINETIPWLRLYASSSKVLENYFFHGFYQGSDKYHKRYTHSRLAILPFIFDKDDLLRKCVNRVSLDQSMAVSHHTSIAARWQWESSSKGLAKFKRKYNFFYGQASMGVCFQPLTRPSGLGYNVKEEFLGNLSILHVDNGSREVEFVHNVQHNRQLKENRLHAHNGRHDVLQKTEPSNCGQILLLQHPISRGIEEYHKMCVTEESCPDTFFQQNYDDKDYDEITMWIAKRGNVIFKHLLFHSEICSHDLLLKKQRQNESSSNAANMKNQTVFDSVSKENITNFSNLNINDNTTDKIRGKYYQDDLRNIRHVKSVCDRNVDIFLDDLEPDEKNYLVNYIVENLASLFSMVALYEDLEKSLHLLDIVHRFPLSECILQQHKGVDSNSNSVSSMNNVKSSFSFHNQVQHKSENTLVPQNLVPARQERINFDSMPFKSVKNSHWRIFKNQEILQDLKDEKYTLNRSSVKGQYDNYVMLNKRAAEDQSDNTKKSKRENTQPLGVVNSSNRNTVKGHSSTSPKCEPKTQSPNLGHRVMMCHEERDFQQLFQRLNKNEILQESLGLDLKIYKEAKKLYQIQKKLVFNTLKD